MITDNEVNISDRELEEYIRDILENWDTHSLVEYAFDCLFNEYCSHNPKSIIEEMTEYYGEDWVRRKKLDVFK